MEKLIKTIVYKYLFLEEIIDNETISVLDKKFIKSSRYI